MPSSLVQRIRIGLNALFGRFRDGRRAVLSGYRHLGKPGNACQNGILTATFAVQPVWSVRQVLLRRLELTGEPSSRARGHGVARCGGRLNATALSAFEGRDAAAGPRRLMLRQQHAVLLAVRAAW